MGDTMQQRLTQDLTQFLASLPEDDRIKAINEIRMAIHQVSPFREEPVDCVLWVKNSQLMPNDYNPNNVAPPEKKLLQKSIEIDGFTQPIVVTHTVCHHRPSLETSVRPAASPLRCRPWQFPWSHRHRRNTFHNPHSTSIQYCPRRPWLPPWPQYA